MVFLPAARFFLPAAASACPYRLPFQHTPFRKGYSGGKFQLSQWAAALKMGSKTRLSSAISKKVSLLPNAAFARVQAGVLCRSPEGDF
jgi:hypothetical protein